MTDRARTKKPLMNFIHGFLINKTILHLLPDFVIFLNNSYNTSFNSPKHEAFTFQGIVFEFYLSILVFVSIYAL